MIILDQFYEEIGFNNSVILLIRCPDLIDLTDKHWLQIQDELSEEFNIKDGPRLYHPIQVRMATNQP